MTNQIALIAPSVAALLLGALLGHLHFAALKRTTEMYARGATLPAVALHLGRFAVLIPALVVAAKLGAGPLLAAALGILLARQRLVRRERRAL